MKEPGLSAWPKAAAALAGLVLISESSAGQLGSRMLLAIASPQSVSARYHLQVVELPPPPAISPSPSAQGCPVELRAVLWAEDPADSLAVVAIGGQTEVLAAGESVRTAEGWVAVSQVASEYALVRKGGATYRCTLADAREQSR